MDRETEKDLIKIVESEEDDIVESEEDDIFEEEEEEDIDEEEEEYDRYIFFEEYGGIEDDHDLSYEVMKQFFFNREYEVDESIESIKERLNLLWELS